MSMSSHLPYVQGATFLVLILIIFYTLLEGFRIPLSFSNARTKQYDKNWKGWANTDKIFSLCVSLASALSSLRKIHNAMLYCKCTELEILSSGDSYTASNFDLTKDQPRPENPFGNPTYDPRSPYLKWMQYLTMVYNDSKVETYNFAVNGATVDQALIDKGSSFSTQVGEKFLPNYSLQKHHIASDRKQRRWSMTRRSRSSDKKGPLADWRPKKTLFSVWFGINDNVFSNRSDVLFDQVFESYRRSLLQVRHTTFDIPGAYLTSSPSKLTSPAPRRRRAKLPLPERAPRSPRSQRTQRFPTTSVHPLLERAPRQSRRRLRLHVPKNLGIALRHL